MADIADVVSELADLWPALAAALARDSASHAVSGSHGWIAATVVNADVLAAIITLDEEVPAAFRAACETIGEPSPARDLTVTLRAFPRLAARMHDLGLAAREKALTTQAAGWLRITKRALGLRKPDVPLGYPCPWAESIPENHDGAAMLLAAGAEGFLRPDHDGFRVEWVSCAQVYCPAPACGASWSPPQWPLLGRMLRSAAAPPRERHGASAVT